MDNNEELSHLTKRIEQVNRDIENFQQDGYADKKVEVLYDYLEYLTAELKILQRKVNASKS